MASCPSCGRRPIRRKKNGLRQCRRCGILPDLISQAVAAISAALSPSGAA